MTHTNALARFRADPKRIRVSLGRTPSGRWVATVATRDVAARMVCFGQGDTPQHAVWTALQEADAAGMPGVDLGLQWAYEHPWRDGRRPTLPDRSACVSVHAPTLPSPRYPEARR